MKVLQVLPTLSAGGAEGFITNLGVSMAELGVEVQFFLLAGARGVRGRVLHERLAGAGIAVVGAEERGIRSPVNILRLVRLIRSWKPHVVQANLYSVEVVCALARVLSIGSGACYVRRLANRDLYGCSRREFRMLDHFFHRSIACSPAVAAAYSDLVDVSNHGKLVTISNGGRLLDSIPTPEEKAQARHTLGIPSKTFVVTHIGGMREGGRALGKGLEAAQKAHDVLLKSFSQAFGNDSECLLLCVGDGPLRPATEELARRLGMDGTIRFLGEMPEPWPALLAADMFCFPSRYEGLPNVLPEAASCGLPIVASDVREISDLCPSAAWLLRPVDDVRAFAGALISVRKDIEGFTRKAQEAAEGFRDRFSMRTCAERYVRAYEQTLRTCCRRGDDRV